MNLDLMKFETAKITMFVPELLNQTCPAYQLESMVLMRYNDADTFALPQLGKHREMTKQIRKPSKLLLSFVKLHKPIFHLNSFQVVHKDTSVGWC